MIKHLIVSQMTGGGLSEGIDHIFKLRFGVPALRGRVRVIVFHGVPAHSGEATNHKL